MAIFNPQVGQGKDEMPDWTRVTRPISDVASDKSLGIALSTVGQGIESTAGIVETTAKDIINKDVRSTVEPIREDWTNQLLATKAIIQGAGATVPPATRNMDLTQGADEGPSVPAGIDSGLKKVDRIQNMLKFGSGKLGVDDTYYDMRLKTAVTDLRTKYPGFVDYIDGRVSAITGMNPANELISDATRQIAQLQSSKKSEYDKWLDTARKAVGDGLQDSDTMYNHLKQNGEAGLPAYLDYYYKENRKRAIFEEQDRVRKASDADKKDIKEKRTSDWTNEVGGGVATAMNTFISLTGVKDQKSLMSFIKDANDNPGKYSEDQLKELASKFMQQKAELDFKFKQRAAETARDDKGRTYSYNSDVGAPEADTIQKNVLSYYDQIEKALINKDAGLAFSHANRAAGMLDTQRLKIYSGPLGEDMRNFNILNSEMGSNWGSIANTQLIKNSVDKTVDGLFEKRVLEGKTAQRTTDGTAPTYKGMADEALSLKQKGQITDRIRSRYLEGGLNIFIEDVTNPKAPIQGKLNALKFFFSPEGQGVLSHFKDDSYDYASKTNMPGRQTVWSKLTSDDVVSEVAKLSKVDPSIGTMYRQWTEKEAGAQLYLKDILNINGFSRNEAAIKYYDGEKGGKPQIELINSKTGLPLQSKDLGQDTVSKNYFNHMTTSIARLNVGLAGMDRVYKGLGQGDATENMMQFLLSAQTDIQKWVGAPKELLDAMAAAKGKGKLQDIMEKGVTK